jgi:hypothetical protein
MPSAWVDFLTVLQFIIYGVGFAEYFRGTTVDY